MDEHSQAMEKRIAQKKLASSLVEMVHGPEALQKVIQSTGAFFKRPISEVVKLSKSEFLENFGDTKVIEIALDDKLTVSGLV
jgi:tyrosyl-tRNA synthetase